ERAHRVLVNVADQHAAHLDLGRAAPVAVDVVEDGLLDDDLTLGRAFARADGELVMRPLPASDRAEVLIDRRVWIAGCACHSHSSWPSPEVASGPRTSAASPDNSRPTDRTPLRAIKMSIGGTPTCPSGRSANDSSPLIR